jgi:cell pole-organizing protein PopZ
VLELSTPAMEEERAPEDDDLLVFDKQDTPEPPPPVVAAAPAPRPAPPVAPRSPDAIISEPVVSQAAGSFNRLAGSLRLADTQGQTVEGVVRELLQPMLREWLDQNLPAIVEAKVEAELDRISRLAR